ncbi:MAG: hypothetical protein ACI9FD_001439 [Gammaproteobacteria bacterium]|jgi:hypothetical protein
MNTLIYLDYGKDDMRRLQVLFSVLSAHYYRVTHNQEFDIILYTDCPDQYRKLPVKLREIHAEELTIWKGPHQYNHRSKPAALLDAMDDNSRAYALIDSDTFFLESPTKIFDAMDNGDAVMWKPEAPVADIEPLTAIREFEYHSAPDIYQLKNTTMTWNSGVIGIPGGNKKMARDIISVIDLIHPQLDHLFVSEQYAASIVLENCYPLVSAEPWLEHYWGSRKKDLISDQLAWFFSEHSVEHLVCKPHLIHEFRPSFPEGNPDMETRVKHYVNLLRIYDSRVTTALLDIAYGQLKRKEPWLDATRRTYAEYGLRKMVKIKSRAKTLGPLKRLALGVQIFMARLMIRIFLFRASPI